MRGVLVEGGGPTMLSCGEAVLCTEGCLFLSTSAGLSLGGGDGGGDN